MKRTFIQFHLATCLIATMAAGCILWLNMDSRKVSDDGTWDGLGMWGKKIDIDFWDCVRGIDNLTAMGWPITMCLSFDVGHSHRFRWAPLHVAINGVIGLVILACLSFGVERGIERLYSIKANRGSDEVVPIKNCRPPEPGEN